ncbi:MAG: DUF1905 domain-containing protein [Myxococcales bacterium]|nr:MAG: DUF1905 domain-containing protein [Myxococcales bacterium]
MATARPKAPRVTARSKAPVARAASADAPTYTFTAPLEAEQLGNAQFVFIHLPDHLQALPAFAAPGRRRMKGTVAGVPVHRAWQPTREGRRYLMLSAAICQQAGLSPGDPVTVSFSLVDDDHVEVPAELREALRQEPAWRRRWAAQTPGRQRGIAHHVDSARSPETRAARAVEALERLEQGLSVGRRRRREG